MKWFQTDVPGLLIGSIFKGQDVQAAENDVSELSIDPIFKGQAVKKKAVWTSGPLNKRPIGRLETSVSNHLTPRNNPESEMIQFNRGGSL